MAYFCFSDPSSVPDLIKRIDCGIECIFLRMYNRNNDPINLDSIIIFKEISLKTANLEIYVNFLIFNFQLKETIKMINLFEDKHWQ